MRPAHAIAAALALGAASCGGYGERYPSYDAVVAEYAAEGLYVGAPLDPAYAPDCAVPDCDCPSVWFDEHWVYYCDGRWVYWYGDTWYTYSVFYVYYMGGVPYPATGPVRSITKGPHGNGHGHHGGPPPPGAAPSAIGTAQPEVHAALPTPQRTEAPPAKRADPPPPPRRRR
jgi:hypothetical protein